MKTNHLIFALLILLITKSFGQFDIINKDPVAENPAFVGSTGSHRILDDISIYNSYNSSIENSLNYDFFSKELKGGWGLNSTYRQVFKISNRYSEVEHNLSYSPKITTGKNSITWAPGMRLSHKNNWVVKTPVFEDETKTTSKHNNIFGASLGLTVNTTNYLVGGYVEYHPSTNQIETAIQYFRQFNKNTERKLSSTLGTSIKYHNDIRAYGNSTSISLGHENIDPFNDVKGENHDLSLNIKYALKYRKFLVGVTSNIPLYTKFMGNPLERSLFPEFEFGYSGEHLQFLLGASAFSIDSNSNDFTLNSTISVKF